MTHKKSTEKDLLFNTTTKLMFIYHQNTYEIKPIVLKFQQIQSVNILNKSIQKIFQEEVTIKHSNLLK